MERKAISGMLRWPFGKNSDADVKPAPQAPARGGGGSDEWAYLRNRPDFDIDEMANVHGYDEETRSPTSPQQESGSGVDEPEDWLVSETIGVPDSDPYVPESRAAPVVEEPEEAGGPVSPLRLEVASVRRKYPWIVRDEALVGRRDFAAGIHPEIDLLMDAAVSPRHAWIGLVGRRYVLRDLQSENGTRVNGRRVTPGDEIILRNGDRIELGRASFIRVLEAPGNHVLTAEDVVLGELLQDALGDAATAGPDEPSDPICTAPR